MRFAVLGSGSRGNGIAVASGRKAILFDCGFSIAETERRLARLGLDPTDLLGVFVTHEHGDHAAGVSAFARRHALPVHSSAGTRRAMGWTGIDWHCVHDGEALEVGPFEVLPYLVPHDGEETVQYVVGDGAARFGMLTDAGEVTPHVLRALAGCAGLLLECNHDPRMLAEGPYPSALKARVGGRLGHLSNVQAAAALTHWAGPGLRHVVAAHLSEKNNRPALARAALATVLGVAPDEVDCASQTAGLDWRDLA